MRVFGNFSTAWVLGGALALALPLCVAQSSGQMAAANPSRSSMSANQRAADLLDTVNKTEIDGAQMIQGKTQNTQVKDFTQTLINDHQDLQNKLETAAGQDKIDLHESQAMKSANQKMDSRLNNESSANADKAFVAAEVRDHHTAIERLQKLEPQITDPDLKTVVQNAILVLQKHMKDAQQLQSQLASSGSGK